MAKADELRIGVHLSTEGGCWRAVERAVECGANTLQIFSASPRMYRAAKIKPEDAAKMKATRAATDVGPLVIHAGYLINVCSEKTDVREKSVGAFRGEVERALALGAEGLVLHPGSFRGMTREEGIKLAVDSIERAIDGLKWQESPEFRILIENTAGAEFSLGGSFEQVGELVAKLKKAAPVDVCLDTCHTHVSGYDIVSAAGYEETVKQAAAAFGLEAVKVWHMNDAKAERGSKLDRHQHIGEGTIGAAAFRRLLKDKRWGHCAFIAETPVDAPGDEARNVAMLKRLATS